MAKRVALLALAIIMAALGTGLVYTYARGADDRARSGQQRFEVLVVKSLILAGTAVEDAVAEGAFEAKELPANALIEGAMPDVSAIQDDVALTALYPGQQINSQMFGETANTVNSLVMPEGAVAASFQFSDPARVAGFVQPGSQVVVFVSSQNAAGVEVTRVLLPQAQVVAVGPTALNQEEVGRNDQDVPRALLTLALTDVEAAKLVYASQHGTLYLALRNENSAVEPGTEVSADTLFR